MDPFPLCCFSLHVKQVKVCIYYDMYCTAFDLYVIVFCLNNFFRLIVGCRHAVAYCVFYFFLLLEGLAGIVVAVMNFFQSPSLHHTLNIFGTLGNKK